MTNSSHLTQLRGTTSRCGIIACVKILFKKQQIHKVNQVNIDDENEELYQIDSLQFAGYKAFSVVWRVRLYKIVVTALGLCRILFLGVMICIKYNEIICSSSVFLIAIQFQLLCITLNKLRGRLYSIMIN